MARDVTANTAVVAYTDSIRDPRRPRSTTRQGTDLRVLRGRADLVESDGEHPTPYGAWDVVISPQRDMLYEYNYNTYKWTWGGDAVGWFKEPYSGGRTISGRRGLVRGNLSLAGIYCDPNLHCSPYPDQHLINAATLKALNKLKDSDANVGAFLGELRESWGLMAQTLASLLSMFHMVRKREWSKLRREFGLKRLANVHDGPKSLANNWLAYQLGWRPLINDLFNGYSAIKEVLARDPDIRVEAYETSSFGLPNPLSSKKVVEGEVQKFCKVGITAKIVKPNLAALDSLGLINPASLAWELAPLSFVMDYFVNVGDFLQALSAPLGLTFHHGYQSFGTNSSVIIEDVSGDFDMLENWDIEQSQQWKVKAFAFERYVLNSFPLPRLTIGSGLSSSTRASILVALKTIQR
jgi:hypothetical protein